MLGKLQWGHQSRKQEDTAGDATATVGWESNSRISQRWQCSGLPGGVSQISLVVLDSRSYSGVRNPSEVPMNRRMGRNANLHILVSVRSLEGHTGTHHPGTPG